MSAALANASTFDKMEFFLCYGMFEQKEKIVQLFSGKIAKVGACMPMATPILCWRIKFDEYSHFGNYYSKMKTWKKIEKLKIELLNLEHRNLMTKCLATMSFFIRKEFHVKSKAQTGVPLSCIHNSVHYLWHAIWWAKQQKCVSHFHFITFLVEATVYLLKSEISPSTQTHTLSKKFDVRGRRKNF